MGCWDSEPARPERKEKQPARTAVKKPARKKATTPKPIRVSNWPVRVPVEETVDAEKA